MSLVAAADADASVFDGKIDGVVFAGLDDDGDTALFGVADGVGDEVLQDFFEVEAALANLADLRRDINVKG